MNSGMAPRRGVHWRVQAAAFLLSALLSWAVTADVLSRARAAEPSVDADESMLVSALGDIREARLDDAMANLELLLGKNPKFRLAQLVYADTLLAKTQAITGFGGQAGGYDAEIAGLREEAIRRLEHQLSTPPRGRLPAEVLQLSPSQKRAVVLNIATSRLYVFERRDGRLALAGDYYISTGKKGAKKAREGDQKTPVGVYFITGRIDSKDLPDFYGGGAFPVNYPNEWDVRLGRTGYGIWLHGVPSDTYARVPQASDGCIALANEDLALLWSRLQAEDTPVIMTNGIEWVEAAVLVQRRDALAGALEQWQRDWESLDLARYARHYSKRFHSGSKDYARWMQHKKRVNARKRFIDVALADVSIFGYPGERDLAVVSFDQNYRSSNFQSRSNKRQYWRREADGQWRIVYEGTVRLRSEHLRGLPYSARSKFTSAFTPSVQ